MANPKRVRGVYGGPLLRGTGVSLGNRKKLLEATGKEAVAAIQKEIRRLSFKKPATKLIDSFSFELKGESTLVVKSDHPGALPLSKGVKSQQMTWLTKANRPIPIITDEGELIFRSATPKSMQEGKWMHPGIRGKNFIDRGVEKSREIIKERVSEAYRQGVIDRFKSIK